MDITLVSKSPVEKLCDIFRVRERQDDRNACILRPEKSCKEIICQYLSSKNKKTPKNMIDKNAVSLKPLSPVD